MATAKKSSKKGKNTQLKSFKVCPENTPFMTLKVTDQTIYWSILLIIVLILGVMALNAGIY